MRSGYSWNRNTYPLDNKIVIRCPKCKNKLRVPLDKGKIAVSCPLCHNEFKYNPNSILDTLKQIFVGTAASISNLTKKRNMR